VNTKTQVGRVAGTAVLSAIHTFSRIILIVVSSPHFFFTFGANPSHSMGILWGLEVTVAFPVLTPGVRHMTLGNTFA
jgi:hypothetical protein